MDKYIEEAKRRMKVPLDYPTKSHRRYYEKRAKRLKRFLNMVFKGIKEYEEG